MEKKVLGRKQGWRVITKVDKNSPIPYPNKKVLTILDYTSK